MSSCTSEEQVTQVKIQMKIYRSPTGLHLFLIRIYRMACHVHVKRPT